MSEKQHIATYKHTTTYIVRGVMYALTSICALFAGYFIQLKFVNLPLLLIDLLILLIPIVASIYFFMCYAERFPTPQLQSSEEDKIELAIRGEAIYIYLFLAVSLICNAILSACLLASLRAYPLPPFWLIFTLLTHAGMYVYYGLFLWRQPDSESIPIIRHQLVWSVVLSIGVSLYFGLSYSALASSWLPIVPVLIVAVVYIITRILRLNELPFLFTTLGSFFVLTILAFIIKKGLIASLPVELGEYLFVVQFCIIVSAYLAVFESWKVTSDIAKKEQKETLTKVTESMSSKAHRYSMATLTALMASVWTLPFFFIFSQYGTLFLIGFGFHSLISFLVWNYWGKGQALITHNWRNHKNLMGVAFLIILVLTSFPAFNKQPSSRTLEDFVNWTGLAILFGIAGTLTGLLIKSMVRRSGTIWQVFIERIAFTRLLSFLSLLACVIILITIHPNYNKNSTVYFKGDLAFIFYSICILLCSLVELVYSLRKTPLNKTPVNLISAFLVLTRAITSFLITFAVFFPSIYTGRSFRQSILLALPFFLSAIGGFALNDYFDVEKDLINKPYRAIPSGILSRNFVLIFSMISLSLALLSAKYFSQNNLQFILYILCIMGVTSYNLFVKYLSLTKTFLTSMISALPILFSVVVFDYPKVYLLLPIAASFFILGREWLMDIRDMKGDSMERTKTIPMIIGAVTAARFGFGFHTIAALLLVPIVIYNKSYWSTSVLIMILISVAVLAPLWAYRSGIFQQRAIQLLWVPMLFGLLLFIT